MKTVAVSMRVVQASGYHDPRDALSHDWITFLERYGVTPLLVPNVLGDTEAFLAKRQPDAVLLTNGNNVGGDDIRDAEDPASDVSPDRDRTERHLITYAMSRGIPVLGVCRGMQMLNVFFGGSLVRDLSSMCGSKDAHVRKVHEIELRDPKYRELTGSDRVNTNSFHRQGVTQATLAPDLQVLAMSSDGVVEAVSHPSLPVVGVQWHPERDDTASGLDGLLMHRLLGEE